MTVAPPSSTGRELSDPPIDGVSNIRFSNHSDHLLVSSWDKSVRLYDASAGVLRGKFMHGGAVLDCCFHDDSSGFTASLDHTVRRLVFNYNKEDILGGMMLLFVVLNTRIQLVGVPYFHSKSMACYNLCELHVVQS
ncbi:UNVERIFIED_CONTAM: Mitotic checkpoint protein BUB3.1 [Sesamum latifolium]|uniref:Mitotic checkpoint protein BUB3.1 n=1 Tax=Sesamum latifolium TaxID=2727402 RepID=A0AAW2V084_9LAMI